MITSYEKDNKKFYEVYVAERDQSKKLIAKRKRGIKSEREAKEIEFRFKSELRSISKNQNSITWGLWHAEFLERAKLNYKNSTVANYDGYLKKWIPKDWEYRPIREITSKDVYGLVEKSKVKLGLISQKNIVKMLRRIFQSAVDEGHLDRNPASGVLVKTGETIKKVLTAKEVEILLRNAKEVRHPFYPVWTFAVKTGMRSGEMYALKWSDIDFEAKLISVSKQWTNKDGTHALKTGDWRVVPISRDLEVFLLDHRAMLKVNSEFVLPRLEDWTHGDQAKVLKKFCALLGITEVKFHDLRATFITNMLAQGVALVKVMAIVGHKKMETTDEYVRLAGVEVRGATEALGYEVPQEEVGENVIAVNFGRRP